MDALHGAALVGALGAAGLRVVQATVTPGEASKTIAGATAVGDAALNGGVDRRTPVVALGGGVVGDLAGFVASTLLRGLPLVQVPTTLMAQVDSSVGGKASKRACAAGLSPKLPRTATGWPSVHSTTKASSARTTAASPWA